MREVGRMGRFYFAVALFATVCGTVAIAVCALVELARFVIEALSG